MADERELCLMAADGRLDAQIAAEGTLSRARAAQLIEQGCVRVAGVVRKKPAFRPAAGERICVTLPPPRESRALPEDIPIRILYEDADLAVVEKPAGMVTHPAAGNERGTLVNALLARMDSLSGIGGEKRPGIVHRLDKDTSGLLLVAKNDAAHAALCAQLAARQIEKHYYAVVAGVMKEPSGTVDKPVGRSKTDRKRMAVDASGRSALTHFRVLWQKRDRALLDVRIVTGRTHQIRVHMASIGHCVLGDPLYGHPRAPRAPRLMLHAFSLAFAHPRSGERLRFTCPPDPLFEAPDESEETP